MGNFEVSSSPGSTMVRFLLHLRSTKSYDENLQVLFLHSNNEMLPRHMQYLLTRGVFQEFGGVQICSQFRSLDACSWNPINIWMELSRQKTQILCEGRDCFSLGFQTPGEEIFGPQKHT